MADAGRRPWVRSVRAQTTGAAVLVLAVVLILGAGLAIRYTGATFPGADGSPGGYGRTAEMMSRPGSDAPSNDLISRREQRDMSVQLLQIIFAVAIPAVLLIVGLMTWWLTGRAMRPVENMRREVEEISASSLDRRVPDPGGRDEIAGLARTMNSMLERLDAAQVAQRRFVSDASHELRSPLAVVRQNAEVALAYPGALSEAELASLTLAEVQRMQRLVESLLLLTRSDELRLQVASTQLDLDDIVFAEAHRLRGLTKLTVDTSGVMAARVTGSAALLDQVVRNLADNAARHAKTLVTFALTETKGAVVLTVDDDGHGIAPAHRDQVFVRFARLDEARARDNGGSGLGLAIVKEIVTAHGGTVQVVDSPFGGARFEVVLPS